MEEIVWKFKQSSKKVKHTLLIAVGFGMATYLIMSGMAMLNVKESQKVENNATNNPQ